ncbi:MAG: IS3 family transposase [Flavobacteriales bacterium]|nr:IS3 family transposase [Flavobacteriales bacterium]
MKDLYQLTGISKQAHFKARTMQLKQQSIEEQAVMQGLRVRADHPAMGCRKIHQLLGEDAPTGRDRFECFLLENGFRVRFPRNYVKTTRSLKDRYFNNLVSGKKLNGINQVWQSDIAYIHVGGRFYYLVFILDVYSRRILGYQVHSHMLALANIKAFKQALRIRGADCLPELIHHSDRGSQYIDKDYLKLQRAYQVTPSMGKYCWENAYAERINGIIKNEYLLKRNLRSFDKLQKELRRSVTLYNEERPHNSLPNKLPPLSYEKALEAGTIKPKEMIIYDSELSTIMTVINKEKRSKKERLHHQ